MSIKNALKKTKLFDFLKKRGLLNKELRRFLIINFIFQRIFRINWECKWSVNFTSTIIDATRIKIGENVWKSFEVSGNCYIQASNGIEIGDRNVFAPGVKLISSNHDPKDIKKHLIADPIKIGKDCWLGTNVVVLPNVVLGNNTIVGAGSIVTKSFVEGNQILVGNPAVVIKKI